MFGGATAFANALNWVKNGKKTAWVATNGLFNLLRTGTIFTNAAKVAQGVSTAVAISAGATGIAIAGAILTSVASAQFQAIVTARPNLEAALASARVPVTLDQIYTGGDGASKLQYLWIMAMDTANEIDDPEVTQLVASANQAGRANGYAAPKE